jgi:hypothetical protein
MTRLFPQLEPLFHNSSVCETPVVDMVFTAPGGNKCVFTTRRDKHTFVIMIAVVLTVAHGPLLNYFRWIHIALSIADANIPPKGQQFMSGWRNW